MRTTSDKSALQPINTEFTFGLSDFFLSLNKTSALFFFFLLKDEMPIILVCVFFFFLRQRKK